MGNGQDGAVRALAKRIKAMRAAGADDHEIAADLADFSEILAIESGKTGRLAALYEAEQIIRAHARDCGCWERMLTDVDRLRWET